MEESKLKASSYFLLITFFLLGCEADLDILRRGQMPSVTISSSEGVSTTTNPIPITVKFSSPVSGFSETDLSVSGGSVQNFTSVDAKTYTFDLNVSGSTDYSIGISPAASAALFGEEPPAIQQLVITYTDPSTVCNGTMSAGYCWHHDRDGESCDDVCAGRGGDHPASLYYAGSFGDWSQCKSVLDAIGNSFVQYYGTGDPVHEETSNGTGCFTSNLDYASWDPVFTQSNSARLGGTGRRVCACGNGSSAPLPPNEISGLSVASDSSYNALLSWTSGGGGTTGFSVAYQAGATPPADCSGAQLAPGDSSFAYEGDQIYALVGSLGDSTQYSFRVCANGGASSSVMTNGLTTTVTTPAHTGWGPWEENMQTENFGGATSASFDDPIIEDFSIIGPRPALFVVIRTMDNTVPQDVLGVTANGTPLTKLGHVNSGLMQAEFSVWYIVGLPSGSTDIAIDSGASLISPSVQLINFSNIDQTTPMGAVTIKDNSDFTYGHALLSQSGNQNQSVLAIMAGSESQPSLIEPQTYTIESDNKGTVSFYYEGMDTTHFLGRDSSGAGIGLLTVPLNYD